MKSPEEIAAAVRRGQWEALGYLAAWILFFTAGTAMMVSSFGVTSPAMGDVLFLGGLCLGNGGGLLVLIVYLVRGTARGEL